ncbi:predicted protein [Coccidioides posadasii str. Silveira]|uniref:Predicted protein n=1 Tax=Coccidioides posadasii (strain RMSCC 757 / Silveira) TaxID=443226 RepID=E9D795_COCPS|nr:predicted protein [Coccidioides posadasii str. Silveira]
MYSSSALALPSSQLDHQITVPYSGEPLTFVDEKIMPSGVNPTTEVQVSRKLSKRLNVLILDALGASLWSLSGCREGFHCGGRFTPVFSGHCCRTKESGLADCVNMGSPPTLEPGTANCLDLRNPPAQIAKGVSASYQDEANDK